MKKIALILLALLMCLSASGLAEGTGGIPEITAAPVVTPGPTSTPVPPPTPTPVPASDWRYNQDVCSLGIRFRDVRPNLTNKWYMFTPLDLSYDHTQDIDLIAANISLVGSLHVVVQDRNVTVTYEFNKFVEQTALYFTLLSDLDSVTNVDIEHQRLFNFGQPISIDLELNGDTKVLLYVMGHAGYDFVHYTNKIYQSGGNDYKLLVEQLQALMD